MQLGEWKKLSRSPHFFWPRLTAVMAITAVGLVFGLPFFFCSTNWLGFFLHKMQMQLAHSSFSHWPSSSGSQLV